MLNLKLFESYSTSFGWIILEIQIDDKQGVQGLQVFVFCVVTVNDEHAKPRFKRKLMA